MTLKGLIALITVFIIPPKSSPKISLYWLMATPPNAGQELLPLTFSYIAHVVHQPHLGILDFAIFLTENNIWVLDMFITTRVACFLAEKARKYMCAY